MLLFFFSCKHQVLNSLGAWSIFCHFDVSTSDDVLFEYKVVQMLFIVSINLLFTYAVVEMLLDVIILKLIPDETVSIIKHFSFYLGFVNADGFQCLLHD